MSDLPLGDPEATFATNQSNSPETSTQQAATVVLGPKTSPIGRLRVPGYDLLSELGQGGMAIVFKARQQALNRFVALKMINAGHLASAEMCGRFKIEAEAVAKLQHPNIVQIYDVGEVDGAPFLALELVEGGDLSEKLDRKPQPPRSAAQMVEILAQALGYAHQNHIIHRDLKPSNILLTKDGTPKVSDFGLAKDLERAQSKTETGSILGTPSYMAPEQAEGRIRDIGPATDVYALGAILYDMLTGRPPFVADSSLETIRQVVADEPVPPCRLIPRTPRDLETICLKALHKNPERRYLTANDLGADLGRFLRDEPIHARPAGLTERAVKWVRRRPTLASVIGLGVVASVLFVFQVISSNVALQERADAVTRANNETKNALQESTRRLISLNVANGSNAMDDGDDGYALHSFAEALRLENGNSELERMHRLRIGMVAQECPPLRQLLLQQGSVEAAFFTSDGKNIITAGDDGNAYIRDLKTGQDVVPPLHHDNPIRCAAVSDDGRLLATNGTRGALKIWDVATGKLLATNNDAGRLNYLIFTRDNRQIIAAATSGHVRLLNADSGRTERDLFTFRERVVFVALESDGQTVIAANADGSIRRCDLRTGQAVGKPVEPGSAITCAALSPDGRTLVTAGEGRARLWKLTPDEIVSGTQYRATRMILAAAFSPDGNTLALASLDATAQIWNLRSGELIPSQIRHLSSINRILFSPDGSSVVTTSDDNTARIWDAYSGIPLSPLLRHNATPTGAVFSPDGRYLLTICQDSLARVWDLTTLNRDRVNQSCSDMTLDQGVSPTRVQSPDRSTTLSYGINEKTRLTPSDNTRKTIDLRTSAVLTCAAFSPDSKLVVTGDEDGLMQIWTVATGQPQLDPVRHASRVLCAAFSQDGRLVGSGSESNVVLVCETDTGKSVGPPLRFNGSVVHIEFALDGKAIFATIRDGTSRLLDIRTGEAISPLLTCIDKSDWKSRLTPDERPVAELIEYGELLSGQYICDTGGLRMLSPKALHIRFVELREKYPFSDEAETARFVEWQKRQATTAEASKRWFAAIWHLERLAAQFPSESSYRTRLNNARAELH